MKRNPQIFHFESNLMFGKNENDVRSRSNWQREPLIKARIDSKSNRVSRIHPTQRQRSYRPVSNISISPVPCEGRFTALTSELPVSFSGNARQLRQQEKQEARENPQLPKISQAYATSDLILMVSDLLTWSDPLLRSRDRLCGVPWRDMSGNRLRAIRLVCKYI